jgi:RNA polymerase sigma-70 factor (ECF subfamily)
MTSGGDPPALPDLAHWLAEAYAPAFRTACLILRNPADAEEAVQDAFLRAWRFRASYRNEGRDDGVKAWLYRVLVNTCYSKLRSENRHRTRAAGPEPLGLVPAADGTSPEGSAQDAETARVVSDALEALPEHLRVPVVLRYYSGLTEAEIATAIGRRPGTVKSRLHEARRRLAGDPRLSALAEGVS